MRIGLVESDDRLLTNSSAIKTMPASKIYVMLFSVFDLSKKQKNNATRRL